MKNRSKNEVEYGHRFLIDFWLIFGPFLEPKSLQNRFRSGFGRALNEDSVSKLKKERSESSAGAAPEHKLEDFGASVGRETGRGQLASHA